MEKKKFPIEFVEKTTPVSNDMLLIADSADSNKVKKIKYSNVKGAKGDPIVWKGAYSGATAYAVNDAVSYNGVSYICILATTGNLPTNVTYWAAMVQMSSATDTGQGAVRLADAAQSIAGTDTESSEPLVPQPSHVKAVRDLVTAEALKIKSKEDVHCATTANITLSGLQTIDGYSAVAGNRALVKDQSTASQNGIYAVAAGAWTRVTDFDSNVNNEIDLGAEVWVSNGTVNGGSRWTLTTTGAITVGTTSLSFKQTYPPVRGTDYTVSSSSWVLSADTERSTTNVSPVLVKQFTVYCNGGSRISLDMSISNTSGPVTAYIYINDALVNTITSTGFYPTFETRTYDFIYIGRANIDIYYTSWNGGVTARVKNCKIGYTTVTGATQGVNTD